MKKVARITTEKEVKFLRPAWVGVDVHKKSYSVTILEGVRTPTTFVMNADPLELVKKLTTLNCNIQKVVYEAGPCGFGLYRALDNARFPAMVIAPSRIPRAITRSGKTDRLDSRKLAEYAARDMLVPVSVPSVEEEGLRRLQRRRHKLTDLLRKNKQNIKSLLL